MSHIILVQQQSVLHTVLMDNIQPSYEIQCNPADGLSSKGCIHKINGLFRELHSEEGAHEE